MQLGTLHSSPTNSVEIQSNIEMRKSSFMQSATLKLKLIGDTSFKTCTLIAIHMTSRYRLIYEEMQNAGNIFIFFTEIKCTLATSKRFKRYQQGFLVLFLCAHFFHKLALLQYQYDKLFLYLCSVKKKMRDQVDLLGVQGNLMCFYRHFSMPGGKVFLGKWGDFIIGPRVFPSSTN